MIIIYFKVDGEIYQVCPNYKTIEDFFGVKAEEFKKIFDYIYIEENNDFIFNNFSLFTIIDRQLILNDMSIAKYLI